MEYLATVPDKYFSLAIIDPPYGIKESAHRNISRTKLAKTRMYKKDFWDYDIPSQEFFNELFRVSKNQIIFGINYFLGRVDIPFSSGRIIWDKVNHGTNFSDCEIAYCSFHHSTRLFRFMWNGMLQGTPGDGARMQGNKKLNQRRIHPTEKPIALYHWILKNYSSPEDKILDTHLGSASSAIAAYDFKISEFVGCEIDKFYFDEALLRFETHTRQQKLIFCEP